MEENGELALDYEVSIFHFHLKEKVLKTNLNKQTNKLTKNLFFRISLSETFSFPFYCSVCYPHSFLSYLSAKIDKREFNMHEKLTD